MAFVTGLVLIDAPASALNNLGAIPGERYDNSVGVKVIRTRDGYYPYVSAQSFRYWLRSTLGRSSDGWQAAPIYREEKVAYTDANPIRYWDDDLFGYMRAPSGRESARAKREADASRANETETKDTITRVSPFRMSTLVAVAPTSPTSDFGVMARQEGDPVPHEHQFYRTTLKGLFSLDLHASGTFWYRNKTGFRNLDDVRVALAEKEGLVKLEGEKAYRLPLPDRANRIATLFDGLATLEGGAKQSLHYTDVAPDVAIMAVTRGGNHIFGHVVGSTSRGLPELNIAALEETLKVFGEDIVSDVYVGWVRGFLDEERTKLEQFAETFEGVRIFIGHPRDAFQRLAADLRRSENFDWLS